MINLTDLPVVECEIYIKCKQIIAHELNLNKMPKTYFMGNAICYFKIFPIKKNMIYNLINCQFPMLTSQI